VRLREHLVDNGHLIRVDAGAPAEAEPPNLTSSNEPTNTDLTVTRAKNAIARGAPLNAVAARLKQMNIDPQLLFG